MWKVIDDILGKGYGLLDYLELLYYFSVVLIPMSLPLTVLLASVMVYGDMAEKHELGSMKSSGISLMRMLRPGLGIALVIATFSLMASNQFKPAANKGFMKKIRSMKTNKLTFVFDEKIFNTEFKNYSIRIEKKLDDGRSIEGALIYDQSDPDKSILNVIGAKSGEMYTSPDQKYLIMDLKDGYSFKEIRGESHDRTRKNFKQQGRPVLRQNFSSMRKVFDLEKLMDLNVTNSNYKKYETMNAGELREVIDSLESQILTNAEKNLQFYEILKDRKKDSLNVPEDMDYEQKLQIEKNQAALSTKTKPKSKKYISRKYKFHIDQLSDQTKTLSELFTITDEDQYYRQGKKNIEALQGKINNNVYEDRRLKRDHAIHSYAFHRMYSWSLVCIIFLFVGAPAGALVRKGGFGYPMLIAIGFYLMFVMSTIIGEKLTRSGSLVAWQGAWLPCLLLLPFAIGLTWRALNDHQFSFNWQQLYSLLPERFQKKTT